MAKRGSSIVLTRDNWEDELEPEDAGTFQPASQEALKDRVLKKAKRRTTEKSAPASNSPFLSFGGFGKKASIPDFNFASKPIPSVTNGNTSVPMEDHSEKKKEPSGESVGNSGDYYRQLKCLNECFQQWIQKHLTKSPYCDFTPVCRDYEKHLKEISSKFSPQAGNNSRKLDSDQSTETVTSPSNSGILKFTKEPQKFMLGMTTPVEVESSAKLISASESSPAKAPEPTITFSFVAAKNSAEKEEDCVVEESDDAPPKNEFKPVQEKDSIYDKRCKLFFKKDTDYVDKGVGVLYLKKLDAKTQLLIRADTNLGNVLLNIYLNKSLPVLRIGKNNVSIVCIPNPPIDERQEPEPTTMLIRVKTSDDADELYSKLTEHAT